MPPILVPALFYLTTAIFCYLLTSITHIQNKSRHPVPFYVTITGKTVAKCHLPPPSLATNKNIFMTGRRHKKAFFASSLQQIIMDTLRTIIVPPI